MGRIELQYFYDGDAIGDLWPYCTNGLSFGKYRNAVGQIGIKLSLRAIAAWCASRNFDVKRMFTPIRSTVVLYIDGAPAHGGWLAATPEFTLADAPDAEAPLTFVDWLGLTAGGYIHPLQTYALAPFNQHAVNYAQQVITQSAIAGRVWPISAALANTDTLTSVLGTIDSAKSLKDFLLERADNTTGTQSFDVLFDAYGAMQVRSHYGYDITASAVFSYPDTGGRFGVKSITLPAWDDYTSDYYLSGAGNGYGDSTGAGGTVITANAHNAATIANTGYWEGASSESDISDQTTLDAKASSYVKNTDKPFALPAITIDADPFLLYPHEEGGNLWVGDTVRVNLAQWAADILPLDLSQDMRIQNVDATIDPQEHIEATLTMMSNE